MRSIRFRRLGGKHGKKGEHSLSPVPVAPELAKEVDRVQVQTLVGSDVVLNPQVGIGKQGE